MARREGRLVEYEDFAAGNRVQDNNLLQCSRQHIDAVMAMLRTQHNIQFTGGLDSRLLTQDVADQIRGLRISQVFFACDTPSGLKPLARAIKMLQMPRDKVRCYVLAGFDGRMPEDIEALCRVIYYIGALPFVPLYQPPEGPIRYTEKWRLMARRWSRPAIIKSRMEHDDNRSLFLPSRVG